MNLPPLIVGVKRSLFRIHDPEAEAADAEYQRIRRTLLERVGHTCQFCGFKTRADRTQNARAPGVGQGVSGYLEVHHIDDDHQNNDPKNLAVTCPFCHQIFHAGLAGKRQALKPIWLPQIKQEDLNLMCNLILCSMQVNGLHSGDAKRLFASLSGETAFLVKEFGSEILKTENLGQILIEMDRKGHYDKRDKLFSGLRMLPIPDAFPSHLTFWSKAAWPAESLWEGVSDGLAA